MSGGKKTLNKTNEQNLVFTFELFTVQQERHELKIHTNK